MKIKKFLPTKGSPINEVKADQYGRELRRLMIQFGGAISPDEIVSAASDMTSPLNEFFDWNNDVAAEKWRKQQARKLCNYIAVEVEMNGEVHVFPMLESIRVEVVGSDESITQERRYISVQFMEKDSSARQQVRFDAIERLNAALETIQEVAIIEGVNDSELSDIIQSLDNYISKRKEG